MTDFLFLMSGDDIQKSSPEEMQKRMERYMVWMKKMLAEGRYKGGQPLEPRGTKVRRDKSVISDGPFLEPKEIIGGYIIVSAKDLNDATEIAKTCPLSQHCEIEVRPLLDMPKT